MQNIDRELNPELLSIIEPYREWFFNQDLSLVKIDGKPDENEYHTSIEYLKTIDRVNHIGFPEITHGIDLTRTDSTPLSFRERIMKLDSDLNHYFNSKFCAVKMYYPPGGYMGWHNNHNCPGYNVLISYSKTGEGFFRYEDPLTKEIVTMPDKVGWFAKVGYYGHLGEPDRIYWHCARAYCERLTLGFVIPDEEMWHYMIEDL